MIIIISLSVGMEVPVGMEIVPIPIFKSLPPKSEIIHIKKNLEALE